MTTRDRNKLTVLICWVLAVLIMAMSLGYRIGFIVGNRTEVQASAVKGGESYE